MEQRVTPRLTVATVLATYPDTVAVFRQHGCPDLRRGVFSLMCRIMSVRAAARVHRIPLDDLLRDLNAVAMRSGRNEPDGEGGNATSLAQ
ncbi:MAG: hypothetical protein M3Y67_07430 [Pseudomonadota bacterium]|nr:hypothetical protein [Pseudomonadota bacterium]